MRRAIEAAVVSQPSGKFEIRTLEIEKPRSDEILVRIVACGICASDISMRDAHFPLPTPIVLGHEGVGVITEIGSNVEKFSVGQHVLLSRLSCGYCPQCMDGDRNFCRISVPLNLSGSRLDGTTGLFDQAGQVHGQFFGQSSFATYALAHEQNATLLPNDLDLKLAPVFACGVLTGAGTIISGIRPRAGSSIVVFGAGTVGLSAALASLVVGCTTIIVVDVVNERLDLALELGATHAVNAQSLNDVVAAVRQILPEGTDIALECTGKASVAEQAVSCLKPKGIAAMLGVGKLGQQASFDQTSMAFSGIAIQGFPTGTSEPDILVPILIDLYRQGRFPIDKIVSYYPFADIEVAVGEMSRGTTIKPVLLM